MRRLSDNDRGRLTGNPERYHKEVRKEVLSFPRKRESSGDTMNERQPTVYILASKRNGTLYTGVTTNLAKRVWEHKKDIIEGFTKKYGVHLLVYYEFHDDIMSAITREKQIKKWNRAWKLELIERKNPDWRDLWQEFG